LLLPAPLLSLLLLPAPLLPLAAAGVGPLEPPGSITRASLGLGAPPPPPPPNILLLPPPPPARNSAGWGLVTLGGQCL
jgi:hypothetical protein